MPCRNIVTEPARYDLTHAAYERSYAAPASRTCRFDAGQPTMIRPSPRTRAATLLGLMLVCVVAAAAHAEEAASFLIESITVEGASPGSASIVAAESHLREGQTYDESQLRDAVSRVQRLPFVIWTDFRLAKGSSAGKYVLIISIKQTKALFANFTTTTRWSLDDVLKQTPGGLVREGTRVTQGRANSLVVGGRAFLGAKGVLNVAGERVEDRNDRYTLSFSQYDLFGTRASITAVASYLQDPGARRSADPAARFDWHHRDNITWELIGVLPIGANDSLRGSWEHAELPVRYVEVTPANTFRPIVRSLPQIRKELFWIHDTTNDPLLPTAGTRITAGVMRTSTPTSGFTSLGRVKMDELLATAERSWTLTPAQSLSLGGSGYDFDRSIRRYRGFARYSLDLWGRERTLRNGDLRLEIAADRIFTRVKKFPYYTESTLRAGVVYRNVWGVLRLEAEYYVRRQP